MRIGVDFDNTIVCYDRVFHQIALEQGLIAADLDTSKDSVRNYLRAIDREDDWTELQGRVYGARMDAVPPYEGVREFFRHAVAAGVEIFIVSHKTLKPFRGPPYDLHKAAKGWLEAQGFFDPAQIGLDPGRVYFELTKADKLTRIASLGCTIFVDDLPEFLADPAFPASVERILFDPKDENREIGTFTRMRSWPELAERHLKDLRGVEKLGGR